MKKMFLHINDFNFSRKRERERETINKLIFCPTRGQTIDIYERYNEHWPVLPAQAAGNSCASGHGKIMAPHAVPNQKSKQKHLLGIAIYLV